MNKRKIKYGISDERAKEFEDYIKSLKGISGNNNFESELHQIESTNNSEKVVYNDIKKEDSNTSDKIDTDLKKLEIRNLNVNESSKEIINQESKDIKEENADSKKVIENKEDDIEEFDAEVLAYKKRKKRRGNISIFDKADYYAKIKRPIWLKLWTWAVILGLEIYFAYSLKYAKEADSGLDWVFNSLYNFANYVINGRLDQFAVNIDIILYVIILFISYTVFNILLIYLPSFISVMSNMGKKEIKKGLYLETIFISIALIVFSILFVRDNNKELNELRKNINNSLRNDNYSLAIDHIKKAKKSDTINKEKIDNMYNNVSHNIINKIKRLYKKDMDKKNYDSINEKITAYNKLDNSYKKIDSFDIKLYIENIDIKRDQYLTKLIGQISNMSPDKARVKLNEVYHNSNVEKDRKNIIGWVPIIGKISYKNYWENVRKEYLKELNKN